MKLLSSISRPQAVIVVWAFKTESSRDKATSYKKIAEKGKKLGVVKSYKEFKSLIGKSSGMYLTYTWGRKVLDYDRVKVLYRVNAPIRRIMTF